MAGSTRGQVPQAAPWGRVQGSAPKEPTLRPAFLSPRFLASAFAGLALASGAFAPQGAQAAEPSARPSAQADPFAFGVSTGAGLPGGWPNLQANSAFWLRWGGPWTEGMVGLTGRTQALSATRTSVFETSGLQLALGLHAWRLHGGLSGSGELLREIVPNEAAPGQLRFHNGAGVVVEPYLGLDLFDAGPIQVQLMGFYPVWQMLKADSVGPRVMLTLWVAPGADKDHDDEDAEGPSPSPSGGPEGTKSVGPEEPAGPEGEPGEIIQGEVEHGRPQARPSASPRPSARPSARPAPRPRR